LPCIHPQSLGQSPALSGRRKQEDQVRAYVTVEQTQDSGSGQGPRRTLQAVKTGGAQQARWRSLEAGEARRWRTPETAGGSSGIGCSDAGMVNPQCRQQLFGRICCPSRRGELRCPVSTVCTEGAPGESSVSGPDGGLCVCLWVSVSLCVSVCARLCL
jgi:hypothetical protein